MALVGDNSLVSTLRVMVSIGLYFNANFYCNHPVFESTIAKHGKKVSKSVKNLLPLSVSFGSLDQDVTGEDLVKAEATLNCSDKTWASFLCILGLSSVLNRPFASIILIVDKRSLSYFLIRKFFLVYSV